MEVGVRVEGGSGEGGRACGGKNNRNRRSGAGVLLQEAKALLFGVFGVVGVGVARVKLCLRLHYRLKVLSLCCRAPAACRVGSREAGGHGLPQHDRAVEVHLPRRLQVNRRRELVTGVTDVTTRVLCMRSERWWDTWFRL